MRTKILTLVAGIFLIAPKSHALWCITQSLGGYAVQCQPWVFATPVCAPEVQESNLGATDRILGDLAKNELKDAAKFKSILAKASQLSGSERLSVYTQMVGVHNDKELVEMIGDREVNSRYVHSLSLNADLTPEQSHMVLEKLRMSLLGQRN